MTELRTKESDMGVVIKIRDSDDGATGEISYSIDRKGNLQIGYKFISAIDINPRQWGLVFTTPRTVEKLSWNRKGKGIFILKTISEGRMEEPFLFLFSKAEIKDLAVNRTGTGDTTVTNLDQMIFGHRKISSIKLPLNQKKVLEFVSMAKESKPFGRLSMEKRFSFS